jgi:hypothetical protein
LLDQIQQSTRDWTDRTSACSYLQLMVDAPVSNVGAKLDGTNLITFLSDRWGRTVNGTFMPYSPEAPAQTIITFGDDPSRPEYATILDADVELNNVNYHFGVAEMAGACAPGTCPRGPGCVMDLQNTLVHELGHLMGLDHTCYDGVAPVRPKDGNGQPIPSCGVGGLSPAIIDATMYNYTDCNETKKRSPEADDVAGICALYPLAGNPHTCSRVVPPSSSGCNFTPTSQVPVLVLVLVLVLVAGRGGDRGRRRHGANL